MYAYEVLYDVRSGQDLFDAHESHTHASLASMASPVRSEPALYAAVQRVARLRDEAIVLTDFPASFYVPHKRMSDDNGLPLLHRVRDCLVSNLPVAFASRRNSPFLAVLDETRRRATEAGLLQHVATITDRATRAQYELLPPPPPSPHHLPPYALQLRHLASIFTLWGAGLAAATLAFVCERICNSFKDHTRESDLLSAA